jgi:hypothetical protein
VPPKKKIISRQLVFLGKHGNYNFARTHCTPDCNFKVMKKNLMTFKQAVYIPISGKTRETRVPDQESHWVPTLETFFFPRLEVKR